ncbi:MAG: biotin--[acetyl-CoA-carboxylase] ligase, partial [Thiobacillaceae bacterium]
DLLEPLKSLADSGAASLRVLPPRLLNVLGRLNAEDFRSGEAIARELGMSRAGVHGLIRQAEGFGVRVQSVRGRGYRLARPLDLLDEARLAGELAPLGLHVLCLPEADSTNARLLALAAGGAPHGTLLAAEWQTSGRGRRGRRWLGVLGAGLAFSLLWRFERPVAQLSGLSLAVGVALARAMRALGATGIGLKWPNDVLLGEAKLAGILIELSGDMLGPAAAVIGVGINIRAGEQLSAKLGMPVADLETACGRDLDRNAMLACAARELAGVLGVFDRQGYAAFRDEWHAWHAWQGRRVDVLGADGRLLTGRAAGVDDQGALLLDTGANVLPILSGDVSLRCRG